MFLFAWIFGPFITLGISSRVIVCTNVYLAARKSWFLTYNGSAHPLWVHRRNRGHSNQTRLQLTAVTCDFWITLSMIHFKSLISVWLAGWILQRFRGVRAWLSVLTAHWKSTLLTAENPWKVEILTMGSRCNFGFSGNEWAWFIRWTWWAHWRGNMRTKSNFHEPRFLIIK